MSGRITVLHVDDDPEVLRLSARLLGRADGGPPVDVLTAESASEGLRALDARSVDCVVSDSVTLPDGDPFVVAARRRDADLPIVLFTAKNLGDVAGDVAEGRVNAYHHKANGGDLEPLRCQIRSLVDRDGDRPAADAEGPPSPLPSPLGADWDIVGRHDWTGDRELGTTVVEALATHRGADPEALDSLYESVDADALAGLLEPTPSGRARSGTQVRFPHLDYEVAVTADGVVAVRPLKWNG